MYLFRALTDFAQKSGGYGKYETVIEDEVEHACKLVSLSDIDHRTRKACDKFVQERAENIVENYLEKTIEAKEYYFSVIEDNNASVEEKQSRFENTILFKNMRNVQCAEMCGDRRQWKDDEETYYANNLNEMEVDDRKLVELENELKEQPLTFEQARKVEETHGFFELVPKDFEIRTSIFNTSPIDMILLISRPNTVEEFQFAQMKILRKVSDAIRQYEEDNNLKEMLLRTVLYDMDRFGDYKNSTSLTKATGGYQGPMLIYLPAMKKGESREEIANKEVPAGQRSVGKIRRKYARAIPLNSDPGEVVTADAAVQYEEILRNIVVMTKKKSVQKMANEIMEDKNVKAQDPKGYFRMGGGGDMFRKERVVEL
jgi:hypothetical protein